MTVKTVLASYRIPTELKSAFAFVCKSSDQSESQVIRGLIRAYIQEAGHKALLQKIARNATPDEKYLKDAAAKLGITNDEE